MAFLAWLRRTHGWLGLWGGLVGLLFGVTGVVQNHRAILHFPAKKVEQTVIQLPLAETPATAASLQAILQARLGFEGKPSRQKIEPAAAVLWNQRELQQPERWQFWFESPQRYARAEYYVGNRFVRVENNEANLIAALARLHQAIGVNAFWVLVADSIAGSIILLAASGLVLWSRLEPRRALGLSFAVTPLALLVLAAWMTI
jgi:hypothetical protein